MRWLSAVLAVSILSASPAAAVGFQSAMAPDPGDRPLELAIWYPSAAPVPAEAVGPFRQALAVDGALAGDRLPLVVISHGKGGWHGGHADTALALALAGFVAVSVTHTGDNYQDESSPPARWMVDRPRHVGRVLDFMLTAWGGHRRLDPDRVGVFGYSAGGYTALVALGGEPSQASLAAHCARQPGEVACELGVAGGHAAPGTRDQAPRFAHDPRIAVAVLAAPALGFAFDGPALAGVAVPVQLWAASEDRQVPYASNTAIVRRALPRPPDFRMVEGAGHYVFLTPCNPRLETAMPEVWSTICVDPSGFDRARFHRHFNEEVIVFFSRELAPR